MSDAHVTASKLTASGAIGGAGEERREKERERESKEVYFWPSSCKQNCIYTWTSSTSYSFTWSHQWCIEAHTPHDNYGYNIIRYQGMNAMTINFINMIHTYSILTISYYVAVQILCVCVSTWVRVCAHVCVCRCDINAYKSHPLFVFLKYHAL